MEKVNGLKMEVIHIQVNIKMTKNVELEHINGKMKFNTLVHFKMILDMVAVK